jgi:hypothetical protein
VENVTISDNSAILRKNTKATAGIPMQYSNSKNNNYVYGCAIEQRDAAKFVQSSEKPAVIAVLSVTIVF